MPRVVEGGDIRGEDWFETEDLKKVRAFQSLRTGVNWNDDQKPGCPANRDSLIRQLLNLFAGLDPSDANLRDGQVDAGKVLGDAYEYLTTNSQTTPAKKEASSTRPERSTG